MCARRLHQIQQVLCTQRSFFSTPKPNKVIQVTPEVSCFDQKVSIRLQGLPSQTKVTVHALTESVWNRQTIQFGSCGHYTTSQTGAVDLEKDRCEGGTYTGVEPMGLFLSMRPNPSGPQNVRFVIRRVETPVWYTLTVHQSHLSLKEVFQDHSHCQPLASTTMQRQVLSGGVTRIPIKEGTLRGTLFLPPGEGPFPGVLDMFGLAGGLMEVRAALLAAQGFAAYALPIYNYEGIPDSFNDQTFDYFENAVRWFGSHQSVAPGGIGVIGVSGGAALSLMMAYKCPQVRALVKINDRGYHSILEMGVPDHDQCFHRNMLWDMNKCKRTEEGLVLRDVWILSDDCIIPLWEKDVQVLTLACGDDGQVDPSKSDEFRQLYPEDRRHLIEVIHYPHAGHLLETPYTPLSRACFNPYFNADLVWGGRLPEHAAAQEDSWKRICDFFRKHLPSSS
ncbi:acyl-coenzyme A amino acid N-acyltransferase 1-like isoform X2 [Babylonia areolata]